MLKAFFWKLQKNPGLKPILHYGWFKDLFDMKKEHNSYESNHRLLGENQTESEKE